MTGNLIRVALLAGALLALGFAGLILSKKPRNDRSWEPGLERLATFERRDDGTVVARNVRDWQHGPQGPVGTGWFDLPIDPAAVSGAWYYVDLFPGSDALAHTMVAFEFSRPDGPVYLALSVEVRKEVGETYSALRGMFRAYELMYVWSTERDALGLRAVARSEEVYGYRLNLTTDQARAVFRAFADDTNKLAASPRFYNTLTTNCTSALAHIVNGLGETVIPFHYSFILTGFSDRYLHRLGYIGAPAQDFAQMRSAAYLSDRIRSLAHLDPVAFSRALRGDQAPG